MSVSTFRVASLGVALIFTGIFCAVVVPALIQDFDVVGSFAAGFVNPYASGYSADVILCWVALAVWVVHESHTFRVKGGWICLLLGIVPGVAVGFPLYLVVRSRQIRQMAAASD